MWLTRAIITSEFRDKTSEQKVIKAKGENLTWQRKQQKKVQESQMQHS